MPGSSPATVDLSSSPVPYVTLYREPATLNGDESGWRSTYTFGVAMEDQDAFCVFLAGSEVLIDLGGGATATRIIPCSDPYRADLLCRKVSSVGTGAYTSTNHPALANWSHAKVTAEFASVPYPTDGSTPFMTIDIDAAPEAVTAAGKRLVFSDGTPISADASSTFSAGMIAITIFNAPDNLTADFALETAFAGTVNNAAFFGGAIPAYCASFVGLSRRVTQTATGLRTVQKTMFFRYRSIDLRKVMRGDWTWDFAIKPDASYIYNAVDYDPLIA